MTVGELGALVAALARDRRRFTLEDAMDESDNNGAGDSAWVAYLYDAGAARAYRVADYPVFRVHLDRDAALPEEWAVPLSRPERNGGRDYSEEDAYITLHDLGRILAHDGTVIMATTETGTWLRALHVRYADDGNDRYHVVTRAKAGGDREVITFAAYADLRATPAAPPAP